MFWKPTDFVAMMVARWSCPRPCAPNRRNVIEASPRVLAAWRAISAAGLVWAVPMNSRSPEGGAEPRKFCSSCLARERLTSPVRGASWAMAIERSISASRTGC